MNQDTFFRNGRAVLGALSVTDLAPLDYRYAIDAAMPVIVSRGAPVVKCHVRPLCLEVSQRLAPINDSAPARAGLWVEPLQESWKEDLDILRKSLRPDAPLIVIASRPLARLLGERRGWSGRPMGLRLDGLARLMTALRGAGFKVEGRFGIHSLTSLSLNLLHQAANLLGRPELGDRLRIQARLNYCTASHLQGLSTVALLFARKI